jgi:4-nitrophenyl phosphatase
VSGLDRKLTYYKLSRSCRAILSGAKYLCTNPDHIYPSEDGLDPGAGAIAAAISKATGVEPLILGKPYSECVREILIHLGVPADTVLYVGDRLDTDISLAKRAGGVGVLVKTGLYGFIRAEGVKPDYVIDSVAEVPRLLKEKLL